MWYIVSMEKLDIIVKMIFGSHLYGTDLPDSDMDIKGIFMPTKDEILLNRVPKHYNFSSGNSGSKNTKDDVDIELFSLYTFVNRALEGQTYALDMLHAPPNMISEQNWIWDEIISNRKKFYTKNLGAFTAYARKQAARYGVKGSRLNASQLVLDILNNEPDEKRVSEIWDKLPIGEHLYVLDPNPNGIRQYQMCGKKLQETMRVKYARDIVQNFFDAYGSRAVLAAKNIGIDWKSVSHAVRAALQVKEIFTENTIAFPLKEAELIKKIKSGLMDYATEVAPLLESLMDEVEVLSKKSSLPEKPDRLFWDKFLIDTVKEYHFG